MASTPLTFPAQYAQFRKLEAEQERITKGDIYDDFSFCRSVGVYKDNMSVLHYALVKNVGEGLADRFVDNIEDVYDVGYKQAALDCALRMKNRRDSDRPDYQIHRSLRRGSRETVKRINV